jgi:hypothetical protein
MGIAAYICRWQAVGDSGRLCFLRFGLCDRHDSLTIVAIQNRTQGGLDFRRAAHRAPGSADLCQRARLQAPQPAQAKAVVNMFIFTRDLVAPGAVAVVRDVCVNGPSSRR